MKRLKTGDWVVVADGARGIVLVNDGTALEPALSTVRTYGQDNPKTSEQGRDKPTRTFESTGTAMFLLDRRAFITEVNQVIEEIFGYTQEEVVGKKRYMDFVIDEDMGMVKKRPFSSSPAR